MTISVQCDECFQSYKVKDERAGQTLKCKACGSRMQVPTADEAPEDLFEDYGEPITPKRKSQKSAKPTKKKSRKKGPIR
jgi:transcription elongation factor Elf1